MKTENWYWISLNYATFGLCEVEGIVTKSAPISKKSIGRKIEDVIYYYNRKKAKSMIKYWENNPATEKYKKEISKKMSGENNPCFVIYTIKNEESGEFLELKGRSSVIEYIMNYKKENNILPKRSPSHVKLLSSGKSSPFSLTKHKPNKKSK